MRIGWFGANINITVVLISNIHFVTPTKQVLGSSPEDEGLDNRSDDECMRPKVRKET